MRRLKRIRRILSILLIFIISSGMYGCYNVYNSYNDVISDMEYVQLKMFLIGDKPNDFNDVYDKVNKIMKEKINAELSVEFLSWADMDEKYPLLFQSGEQFDLIFTAESWGHYNEVATRNGFYELTLDMVKEYAPDIYENEPKEAWDQAKVNNKIYMIPGDQIEYGTRVFGIRGDLARKYGIGDINNYDDLEKYMNAVSQDKESGVKVIANGGGQNLQYPYMLEKNEFQLVEGTPIPTIAYNVKNNNGNIFAVVDTEEYKNYALKMKEFAERGYWSADSIVRKATRDEDFINGKSAVMVWNLGSVADRVERINEKHPQWEAEIVDLSKGVIRTVNPYTNNGMAINATSKNPERALMALNLLRYNKEIQELTWYGIEGVHWNAEGDSEYSQTAKSEDFPPTSVCPWGWYSNSLHRVPFKSSDKSKEIFDTWVENYTIDNILNEFSFDDRMVKNEMSAVNNVIKQYGIPIDLGMCDDVYGAINEYKEKLMEAGLYKILDECNNQINDYIKEKQMK